MAVVDTLHDLRVLCTEPVLGHVLFLLSEPLLVAGATAVGATGAWLIPVTGGVYYALSRVVKRLPVARPPSAGFLGGDRERAGTDEEELVIWSIRRGVGAFGVILGIVLLVVTQAVVEGFTPWELTALGDHAIALTVGSIGTGVWLVNRLLAQYARGLPEWYPRPLDAEN